MEGCGRKIGEFDCCTVVEGDATKLQPPPVFQFSFCDPPYGTTQNKWDVAIPFDVLWRILSCVLGTVVFTTSEPFTSKLILSNPKAFKYDLIWDKIQVTGFLNSKKQPLRRHENIVVFYDKQPNFIPQMTVGSPYKIRRTHGTSNYGRQRENSTENAGVRFPTSIIQIPQRRMGQHPTQKPVELVEYFLNSFPSESCFDPFCGSGSTLVAAKKLGRHFLGIEIEPKYVEIARARLAEIPFAQGIKPCE